MRLMNNLASFLFTPKQQRILAALLLNTDRGFSFTELREQAQSGVSSVQLFLHSLERAGLVNTEMRRASKLYRFNANHPLAPELKSIAIKSFALTEPLLEALWPFAAHIAEAFVFGSIAKGSARHDSDVDLMLIGDVSLGEVSLAMTQVEQVLGRSIHLNVYDVKEWEELSKSDPIVSSIAKGPRIELDLTTASPKGTGEPGKRRFVGSNSVRLDAATAVS